LGVIEQFLNHIEQHKLCKPTDRVLLAVSGGIDSMIMVHLFHRAGFSIAIAHCNFQLRGADSDGDEDFVKATARQLNIPCFINRFETAQYAEVSKLSTQMAARELRYTWFEELLAEHSFDFLATAHHLNDSLETVLLNWVHGASLEGFTGIPVQHGKIIRPMLFATRDAIEQYAQQNTITWREDISNQTDDYQRNFIRHRIIPALKEINPSLESTVQRGFTKAQGEIFLIKDAFDTWREKYTHTSERRITIQKNYFSGLPHEASILWKFLKMYGFNYDVCTDIIESLPGQSGKRFFSSSYQLVIDRELLIVTPSVDFVNDVYIEEDQHQAQLDSWQMDIYTPTAILKSTDPLEATLDADSIVFPLVWRKWKAGDAFFPLGMNHRKKVSDFLIDQKISVADKDSVTVLESQGEIIWIVGYRIDNRFKLTDKTSRALTFKVSSHFR
jgi:tRNA(Ile)-lysidine synthase